MLIVIQYQMLIRLNRKSPASQIQDHRASNLSLEEMWWSKSRITELGGKCFTPEDEAMIHEAIERGVGHSKRGRINSLDEGVEGPLFRRRRQDRLLVLVARPEHREAARARGRPSTVARSRYERAAASLLWVKMVRASLRCSL